MPRPATAGAASAAGWGNQLSGSAAPSMASDISSVVHSWVGSSTAFPKTCHRIEHKSSGPLVNHVSASEQSF